MQGGQGIAPPVAAPVPTTITLAAAAQLEASKQRHSRRTHQAPRPVEVSAGNMSNLRLTNPTRSGESSSSSSVSSMDLSLHGNSGQCSTGYGGVSPFQQADMNTMSSMGSSSCFSTLGTNSGMLLELPSGIQPPISTEAPNTATAAALFPPVPTTGIVSPISNDNNRTLGSGGDGDGGDNYVDIEDDGDDDDYTCLSPRAEAPSDGSSGGDGIGNSSGWDAREWPPVNTGITSVPTIIPTNVSNMPTMLAETNMDGVVLSLDSSSSSSNSSAVPGVGVDLSGNPVSATTDGALGFPVPLPEKDALKVFARSGFVRLRAAVSERGAELRDEAEACAQSKVMHRAKALLDAGASASRSVNADPRVLMAALQISKAIQAATDALQQQQQQQRTEKGSVVSFKYKSEDFKVLETAISKLGTVEEVM